MSLHANLLQQADTLAHLDQRRPRQVNLRKAASSAYYALYHLLVTESSNLYSNNDELIARISRTHNHSDLRKVATAFSTGRLPKAFPVRPPASTISTDLQMVLDLVVDLQRIRHEADYNLTKTFTRVEVETIVGNTERAFEAWSRVRKTDDGRMFLACLLLWDRWDKDPR